MEGLGNEVVFLLTLFLTFHVILKLEGDGCHQSASLCPIGYVERTSDVIESVKYIITIKRQLDGITIGIFETQVNEGITTEFKIFTAFYTAISFVQGLRGELRAS